MVKHSPGRHRMRIICFICWLKLMVSIYTLHKIVVNRFTINGCILNIVVILAIYGKNAYNLTPVFMSESPLMPELGNLPLQSEYIDTEISEVIAEYASRIPADEREVFAVLPWKRQLEKAKADYSGTVHVEYERLKKGRRTTLSESEIAALECQGVNIRALEIVRHIAEFVADKTTVLPPLHLPMLNPTSVAVQAQVSKHINRLSYAYAVEQPYAAQRVFDDLSELWPEITYGATVPHELGYPAALIDDVLVIASHPFPIKTAEHELPPAMVTLQLIHTSLGEAPS